MHNRGKTTIYFTATMIAEILSEARRLNRKVSSIVAYAWKKARAEIRKMPSANDQINP